MSLWSRRLADGIITPFWNWHSKQLHESSLCLIAKRPLLMYTIHVLNRKNGYGARKTSNEHTMMKKFMSEGLGLYLALSFALCSYTMHELRLLSIG